MGAAYLKGPPAPPPTKAKLKCMAKRPFSSEHYARKAARGRLTDPGCSEVRLWPYQCHECCQWHLTKRDRPGVKPEGLPREDDFGVVT